MAKCSLCQRDNIGFMGGYVMNGIPGKICDECHSKLISIRSSYSEDLAKYFQDIIASCGNASVSDFLRDTLEKARIDTSVKSGEIDYDSAMKAKKEEINSVLLSTTPSIERFDITSYSDIVTGISVLGTGFMSELSANLSDLLGVNATAFEGKLSTVKNDALFMLKKSAYNLGCNAVVGVSLNFIPFSGNMVGLVATGTAVKIVES